ncbi:NAD-dependent epimerase/dehydratase family protein [Methanocella conradii]|uniref:NAD-dependent epimerase/dehydratase family protein n=1 Tax=Methanocella conradii TaxID=1175444 RepID=UPI0024B34BC3|nr:NAD-dependent epimerase/dehydratase family protein [Methanocella conradii]MDI6896910.1 NAD-dependent epimerase/dehydratase family protein [Methanocella conradii]
MRSLVTGCAGFIGSHVVDALLKKGHEVIGIDCFTDYYPREVKERNIEQALHDSRFTLIEKDLALMDSYPEVDYVFHLAAQAGVRASWGKTFDVYVHNNIQATQRLLEFYKGTGLKKLVYSSSSSVYGDARLPMSEESLPRPVSPYGVSKLAGENLCYLYYKNYGVPTISLRYFTVYGPRLRPDLAINRFVDAIINDREVVVYGDGTQTRDFTFVDDVVRANILAAESDVVGDVFNIGGGHRISVNDLMERIEATLRKKARVRHVEKQKGDVENTWADVSKAKALLSWQPEIGISRGLARYIDWYVNFRLPCKPPADRAPAVGMTGT